MCIKINKIGKQVVGIWWVQKRFPRYGVPIWSLWPNIRFLLSIVAEKNATKNANICSMCIKINSRQTGSRNLMGPKTPPTIWGTYMTLVTKYKISAINSYWEKFDEKYLGRTEVKQYNKEKKESVVEYLWHFQCAHKLSAWDFINSGRFWDEKYQYSVNRGQVMIQIGKRRSVTVEPSLHIVVIQQNLIIM